ncbi:MAG: hypothetical protein Q4B57_00680 [Eubacteriales bacterium]|nr:hypothetical protein [Eubacteriales bacterium]
MNRKIGFRKGLWAGAIWILTVLLLTGCSARDLEDRTFPQAMEVELVEQELQGGFGEHTVRGSSLQELIERYQAESDKYVDLGHVKVLVLGTQLLGQKAQLQSLMEEMNAQPILARNILVVSYKFADEKSCLKKLEEKGIVPGEYLSDLYKNNPQYKKHATATLAEVIAAVL